MTSLATHVVARYIFYLPAMIPLYVRSVFPVLSDSESIQNFSTIHTVQWTYLRVLYTPSCATASFLLATARLITALLRTITAHVLEIRYCVVKHT